jgi:hypothetical protein
MRKHAISLAAAILVAGSSSMLAGTINVLWYTGGVSAPGGTSGSYAGEIANLTAQEMSAFNISGSVNTWNVTTWAGGPMPAGSFNVLVTVSREGGWSTYPNYASLVAAAPTLGNRIMVTGQDADWHYQYGPGNANFNGPAGFLIDAINWAGSGSGMGAVFMSPGDLNLALLGVTGLGGNSGGDNTVIIPGAFSSFPINSSLTSAGLSGWNTSAHDSYFGYDTTKWVGINLTGFGDAVTLVSKDTAGGGTSGGVPDVTSTAGLLLVAFAGLILLSRRSPLAAAVKA